MTLTPEQREELIRLKRTLPFRIVFGALSPEGEWSTYAKYNRRTLNALARKGWHVFEAKAD